MWRLALGREDDTSTARYRPRGQDEREAGMSVDDQWTMVVGIAAKALPVTRPRSSLPGLI